MKKLTILLLLTIGIMVTINSQAQTKIKLGHIDFATLYQMMPGLDSVRLEFEKYNKSIQEQFAAMQTELENKFMDYQSKTGSMSEIIRSTKEAEINDLKERMDAFEVTATEDLQEKEMELTAPIIEKAKKAVEEVAKENSYTYIFNSTEGLLLYADPVDNIMDKVKAKLGITKPTPKPRGQNPNP
ncbi:MAG: OmpH family outer membrane protein [Bacteroidales bacterium]